MRTREVLKTGMMGAAMALLATPAFARTLELKEAGTAFWVFASIGAIIVLLQLIPAAVLFFSFVGTTATMALKKEKPTHEEITVSALEPVAVEG